MVISNRISFVGDDNNDIELTLNTFVKSDLVKETMVVKDGAEVLGCLFFTGTYISRPSGYPIMILPGLTTSRVNRIQQKNKNDQLLIIFLLILLSSKEKQDLKECHGLSVNANVVNPVCFDKSTD